MANFFELIERRESCRNYDKNRRPLTEDIAKCIQAANLSPSACNSQPWSFVVVNSEEKSPLVAKATQQIGLNKFTENCPAFVVVCEEQAKLLARLGGFVHNQAYAQIDIGIAVTHLCYAACELGLSTCVMGAFDEAELKKILNIPQKKRIRLVVAIGYSADEKLRSKKRKDIEEIVRFVE